MLKANETPPPAEREIHVALIRDTIDKIDKVSTAFKASHDAIIRKC
jgi:hypothetical protein